MFHILGLSLPTFWEVTSKSAITQLFTNVCKKALDTFVMVILHNFSQSMTAISRIDTVTEFDDNVFSLSNDALC